MDREYLHITYRTDLDAFLGDVLLASAALKRLVEPEEVADAVAFLCSPTAASMTGTSLVLDGGWTAHRRTGLAVGWPPG